MARTDTPCDVPGSSENALLDIHCLSTELRMRRRSVYAVNNVSLSIQPDETLGLVGESGCGKTMLTLSVMRLLPADIGRITSGTISFAGQNLVLASQAEMREIRGARIAIVFQEPMTSLDPLFTIGSQITETVRSHLRVDKQEARRLAIDALERVRLPSAATRVDNYPHQLSGGMRQRAMIAMALCLRPQLLLLDEPTTALDVTVQAEILELVAELQAELHMGVLLVSHNLAVVAEVCDRVAVMYAGEIVESASATELFQNPRHPYTQALLRSTPGAQPPGRRLHVVQGRPPLLTQLPIGCPFRARCPHAITRCEVEHPDLKPDDWLEAHHVRCWNPQPFGGPDD